jgi:hypothetical protein
MVVAKVSVDDYCHTEVAKGEMGLLNDLYLNYEELNLIVKFLLN